MREILFKALNLYTREWIEGYYAFKPSNKYYIIQDSREVDIDISTLCQYTGLKDSLGNRIFEGDLIKLTSISDMIFVINWNHDDCCYEVAPLGSDTSFPLNDLVVKEAIVVGNKFGVL